MSEQHLDLDVLADLLVGEGDAAAVAHVGSCTACSGRLSDLDAASTQVEALLRVEAARPLPPPPADLADRLRSAALPARTPGAGGAGSTVLPGTVSELRPRAARRRNAPGLAAAAAVVLVTVGLGAFLTRSGSDRSGDAATSAVASAPAADLPVLASGNDYTDAAGVGRALPLLLGTTTGDGAAGTTAGSGSGGAGSAAQAAPAAPSAAAVDPLARLRDPAQLAGCLAELTGPDSDVVPLALDYARWKGQPALAVVLPTVATDKVDVFVVAAGCTAGDDQTLFFTRQPRA